MLASMTPQQFEEWRIMHEIDRWGDENFQASAIGAEIVNAIKKSAAGDKFQESDMLPLDHFVAKPPPDIEQRTGMSPEEYLTVMQARIGV